MDIVWLTSETAKVAGPIKIEEMAVPLHTVVRKGGVSNTGEAATKGAKENNKGSKIKTRSK